MSLAKNPADALSFATERLASAKAEVESLGGELFCKYAQMSGLSDGEIEVAFQAYKNLEKERKSRAKIEKASKKSNKKKKFEYPLNRAKTDMAEYIDQRRNDVSIAEKTAQGETDDKRKGEPGQKAQIASGSTDAETEANLIFEPVVTPPALAMIFAEYYDMAQGYSRINEIYRMNRATYYGQSGKDAETKTERIDHKARLFAEFMAKAVKPMEAYGATIV